MSLTMEEYLNHVQSSITQYLEDIYAIEQKQIEIGAIQTFKEYREYLSKKSSLGSMKKEHADQAKVYGDEIKESQLKTHPLYGDLVQKSGELLRIAQQGFKEVYGINDGEKGKLKNEIKLKHGPSSLNLIGTKNRDVIDIVWEGRNQSVHIKDGLHRNVTKVFQDLQDDFSPRFDNYLSANMAYEVVSLLDWLLDIEEVIPQEQIDQNSDGYTYLKAIDLGEPLPEPQKIGYNKFRDFMLGLG